MAIVVWDGSLAIGVDIIDTQHRELFRIINSFHDKIGREEDCFALAVVLDSLKNYVHYHFNMEERLLDLSGCPELESHRGAHRAFMVLVERYASQQENVTGAELLKLQSFLIDWLTSHISGEDFRLKDYLTPGPDFQA
jgi:hemerythrin